MVSGHGPEFTSLAAVYFHGTWCRREPHIDEIVSWKGYRAKLSDEVGEIQKMDEEEEVTRLEMKF